jgi:FkbM family methyltransferase
MILVIGLYFDVNARRRDEFIECLRRNSLNPFIEQLHVFMEQPADHNELHKWCPSLDFSKITFFPHSRRLTYKYVFAHANRKLSKQRVILANSDIYFDETIKHLSTCDLTDTLLCLSRWDVQANGSSVFFDHPESQDAWVFLAPVREFPCEFPLGTPACDNRVAWEAANAGLTVFNPSRSIRAHHLHLSCVRRYSERERVFGPTRAVPSTSLSELIPSSPSSEEASEGMAGKQNAMKPSYSETMCASAVFRETMGYTIARLEIGVSSHNNDVRPFVDIPEPLISRCFTQVVACSTSPVEVEFVTAGKLYVLVGTDWDGSRVAMEWLRTAGEPESMPQVHTASGRSFEVWSLTGEAGMRFVIPTQVILVGDSLEKRPIVASSPVEASNSLPDPRSIARESLASNLKEKPIYALTSLSPGPRRAALQTRCIESWREAGLQVRSFNHPSELSTLANSYDAEFVEVKRCLEVGGRQYVPISAMLRWAREQDARVLIINSDIELQLSPSEMCRLAHVTSGGLCCFVRHNHDGDKLRSVPEPYGIDAFLLHGSDAELFPDSLLSMGQPFWDYWLPYTFAARKRSIYSVEFPAAYHRNHPVQWSWENWYSGALEFLLLTGESSGDRSLESCFAMARGIRQFFDRRKTVISPRPPAIRQWIQQKFNRQTPLTFFELGAHEGTDTAWLAGLPGVNLYAFEPDPRNNPPIRTNVKLYRMAVSDQDGTAPLILSKEGWGRQWTHSSSIKLPKNHLIRYPVSFGESIPVRTTTLDTFYRQHGFGTIDFIWADIQGAEAEMIRGGRQTLSRTRYLYTEYSDDELYEGQPTLAKILEMLPDFRVVEVWPDDVLFENRRFCD